MKPGKINTKALRAKLEDLILDAARESLPGEDKLRNVVDAAADWLAKQTKIPVPDPIEAAVYRTILWVPVQFVFDALRDAGRV